MYGGEYERTLGENEMCLYMDEFLNLCIILCVSYCVSKRHRVNVDAV